MNVRGSGRLARLGGPRVETRPHELVREAARVVVRFVAPNHLKALVVARSYGRGEREAVVREDGEPLTGALDLILFTTGLRSPAREHLDSRINGELEPLRRRYAIGIDLSVVDARAVERDQVCLRWYEGRRESAHPIGDPGVPEKLVRFTVDDIDPEDSDLIVDCSALLVLNEINPASDLPSPTRSDTDLIGRGVASAGSGNASEASRAVCDRGEVERRRRMADRTITAPARFKALYETAMRYRVGMSVGAARF